MYILGLGQIGGLDASVTLLKDGEVRYAVAEERVTRIKHIGGFPAKALDAVMAREGITLRDVSHIAIVDRPWYRFVRRSAGWYLPMIFTHPRNALYHTIHNEMPVLLDFLRAGEKLKNLSGGQARIHFVGHHLAHMASAFFVSPFDEAAILSYDARGEVATTVMGHGRGNTIRKIGEARMPHSLGVFYAAITDHLGFRFGEDEYKVMGLASYGEPRYADAMNTMIRHDKKNLVRMNLRYFIHQHGGGGFFSKKFFEKFGPARKREEAIEKRHMDIAASAQAVLERIALKLVKDLKEKTGVKHLCMAGGVALNCTANGKIYRSGLYDDLYIQPAAGDDGGSLGAAYYVYNQVLRKQRHYVMRSAALGFEYGSDDIEEALKRAKLSYRVSDHVCRDTAALLAGGKIVGWFRGRAEFGPRALGNRSILADPTSPGMKDLINKYVKFREEFRPFAPSVKKEAASVYFELNNESPFMLFVVDVKPEHRTKLPAVTHADGTARVQTVDKEVDPIYWDLLDAFEKLTGVPVLLNTSFNVMGEPMVCSPDEAIRCFFSCGLDALVMENHIIEKVPGAAGND